MNQTQVRLYHSPSFFTDPISHLQQIWSVILADFQSLGMSFQRVSLLAAYTIELLHQARSLPPESKQQRDQIGRFLQWYPHISIKAQGGYLNHLLGQSIVSQLMMTGGNLTEFQKLLETRITYMLSEWVQAMKIIKKNKEDKIPYDVWGLLNIFLAKPQYDSIYDKLLFIEFIKKELTQLEPDWLTIGEKQLQNTQSVIKFLSLLIPKVLFNVVVQAQYFPKAMTEKNQKQAYDILYLNQNKHTQLMKRIQFQDLVIVLIQNSLKNLDKLQQNQQNELLNIVINFFSAYHTEHLQKATKFLLQCFKKLSSTVRFAKFKEVLLFFTVLEKLQYNDIIKQLFEQFSWIQQLKQKIDSSAANPRNAVEIFLNQEKNLIIPASQKAIQLVEIFRPYSLVYFDISCKAADIDVNFCYAGNFEEPMQLRKIIFEKKKLKAKEDFKGSIEAVQPGLYYLQFDNTYSWMTAKSIGYKLEIVVPMDVQYPFEPAPYSRFLISQLSHKLPYQLTIDHNFFIKKDISANNSITEGTFCDIQILPFNYVVTVGDISYQLQTQNQKSAYEKLSVKITNICQKFNIKNFMINQKPYHDTTTQVILKRLMGEILGTSNDSETPNSPVNQLNELQSRSSLQVGDKKLSIIREQTASKPSSQIKEQKQNENQKQQQKALEYKNQQQNKQEQLKEQQLKEEQSQTTQQTKQNKLVQEQPQSSEEPKEIVQQTI